MKKLLIIFSCVIALLFTSCGFVGHNVANMNLNNTNVILQKKNYHIVKAVEGRSQQTYILGIGGMSEKSLKDDAIRELYRNANLTGSQAIINEQVTIKNSFFIIGSKKIAHATALVIEFDE